MRLLTTTWLGIVAGVFFIFISGGLFAYDLIKITDKLDQPWGVVVIEKRDAYLITTRGGVLYFVNALGEKRKIDGLPLIKEYGQGGLLDVALSHDFDESGRIYLSFAHPSNQGFATRLIAAKIDFDDYSLSDHQTLYTQNTRSFSKRHFGGRIGVDEAGAIYLTLGDRGDRKSSQDTQNDNGAIVRFDHKGEPLADNPYVGDEMASAYIYSYGHRNPQGLAFDDQGRLWVTEHGARGGDELNLIKKGANYGWPIIAYGRHYSGFKIGEGTHKPGLEQPHYYWDPSMAPSGLAVYLGGVDYGWQKGDMLAGALKFRQIVRLRAKGDKAELLETIKLPAFGRIRDLDFSKAGELLILSAGRGGNSKNDGALFLLKP